MTQMNRDRGSNDGGELQERVVQIRRVAKVVKGGRHLTFNAMVVVGDGKGTVGAGLGKGAAVPDAVRKGTTIARKDMVKIPLHDNTIPHSVRAHFGASMVLMKPAQPGSGVKAGGAVSRSPRPGRRGRRPDDEIRGAPPSQPLFRRFRASVTYSRTSSEACLVWGVMAGMARRSPSWPRA